MAKSLMKILVCGGTGFLGRAITTKLLGAGNAVRVLGRSREKIREIFGDTVSAAEGDITKPETLPKALEGMDGVVQCAQFPGHPFENRRKGHTYWRVDAMGTENISRLVKPAGIKHLIYISGAGTNGQRTEPWFKAKWYAEQSAQSSGVATTILRPSWIYGPEDKSLNRIIAQARALPLLPMIGDGKNHIQPLFVEDLAEIVSLCFANSKNENAVFEIGGPNKMTMKEMMQKTLNVLGKNRLILSIPKWLMKMVLGKNPVNFITMDVRLDTGPLKKEFPNYRFVSLEEGLKKYL